MVENGRQISIEYTLKLDDGSTADTNVGEDPLTFVQGEGEILEALETALAGSRSATRGKCGSRPSRATGPSTPTRSTGSSSTRSRGSPPVDAMLVAEDEDGNQQSVRVHEVGAEEIVLDLNHPLAGQALNFAVRIVAID